MGDKDFVKPLLESQGTVHFGKVCPAAAYNVICTAETIRKASPVTSPGATQGFICADHTVAVVCGRMKSPIKHESDL